MFWRRVSDWIHYSMRRCCKDKRATVGDVWVYVYRVGLENCAHTYRYLIKGRGNHMFVCLSPYLYFYTSLNQVRWCLHLMRYISRGDNCVTVSSPLSLLLCRYKDCGIEMLIRQGCDWPCILGDKWGIALMGLHLPHTAGVFRGAIIAARVAKKEPLSLVAPVPPEYIEHIWTFTQLPPPSVSACIEWRKCWNKPLVCEFCHLVVRGWCVCSLLEGWVWR